MHYKYPAPLSQWRYRYLFLIFFPLLLLTCYNSDGQTLENSDYPVVWLRADSTGSITGIWKDVTGNGHDASVFGKPVRQNLSLNYNPAFLFNGKGDSLSIPCNIDSISELTIMAVIQCADTAETGIWGAGNALAHKTMMSTRRIIGPDGSVDSIGAPGKVALLSTVIQNWRKSAQLSPNAYIVFGSAGQQYGLPSFKGTIAELLVFDRSLDVLTQIQYETYLAIKYGIPLTRGNYVSAGQTVLWDAAKNKDYDYRMTGLGRESFFSLHQKQAVSSLDTDSLLTIGNGRFTFTNAANTDSIINGNYLVWGDNNKPLVVSATADGQLQLVNRQWLMNVSGAAASNMKTTIRLNQKLIGPDNYWMVINSGGYAGFPVDSLNYYLPDSITADGMVIYRNVQWDTDHSGSDLFSFVQAKDLLLKMNVLDSPTCASQQSGKARLQAIGGAAPYFYSVLNSTGQIVTMGSFTNTTDISNLSMGAYNILLTDSKGHKSYRNLSMLVPAAQQLNIGLQPYQSLTPGGEIVLDASRNIAAGTALAYQWQNENGFNSNSAAITVREPGTYIVTVAGRAGCTFKDTVVVNGSALLHVAAYPSPSQDGHFTISVSLPRAGNVNVAIYDVNGNKVQEMTGSNNTEFRFPGHLATSGLYMISVKTDQGIESTKLLIL